MAKLRRVVVGVMWLEKERVRRGGIAYANYSPCGLLLNARRVRLRVEALDNSGGDEDRRFAGGVVEDLE